ncbi:hypothetical protein [Nonomuraea sp. NPDC049309]|uniref:hypothetical protein n=1 Tax=Nonomuraea sp. NPDC049309 TaxID=3364350 RepID=UPI003712D91C
MKPARIATSTPTVTKHICAVIAVAALLAAGCSGGREPQAPPSPGATSPTGSAPPSGTSSEAGTLSPTASATSSGSPSPTVSEPANPARAEGEIRRAWETFFNERGSTASKVKIVENGEMNELMVQAFGADKRFGEVSSRVRNVRFDSPTRAQVSYVLRRGERTLLSSRRGKAVEQGGRWKIAFSTVCSWAKYGEDVPKAPTC